MTQSAEELKARLDAVRRLLEQGPDYVRLALEVIGDNTHEEED